MLTADKKKNNPLQIGYPRCYLVNKNYEQHDKWSGSKEKCSQGMPMYFE